jgi:hypothetical protein
MTVKLSDPNNNHIKRAFVAAWTLEVGPYGERTAQKGYSITASRKNFVKWMKSEWGLSGFKGADEYRDATLIVDDPELLTFFVLKYGY